LSTCRDAHVDEILTTSRTLRSNVGSDFHERWVEAVYSTAARIADRAVTKPGEKARLTFDLEDTTQLLSLLKAGGWSLLTGINLMLFSLIHNPCSTTIYTIYKETGSAKWTAVAALMPVILGFAVTLLVAAVWRALAG
jgi:Fe2+ transport system protein B